MVITYTFSLNRHAVHIHYMYAYYRTITQNSFVKNQRKHFFLLLYYCKAITINDQPKATRQKAIKKKIKMKNVAENG